MKVEFEVKGFKCAAQTDYVPPVSYTGDEVRAAMFSRLTKDVKDIAMEYIATVAKGIQFSPSKPDGLDGLSKPLNGDKNADKINQGDVEFDPDTWPEVNPDNRVSSLPLLVRENAEIFKRALETKDEFAQENIVNALDEFLSGQRSLREARDMIISLLGK